MNLSDTKTIIFDYDGTIHNSFELYKNALLMVFDELVEKGLKNYPAPNDEVIKSYLGMNPLEMWNDFGEGLPEDVKKESSKKIGQLMGELLLQGKASLYPNALKTLNYLKKQGYHLVFLSNCTQRYMENHTRLFTLNSLFDVMINAEMYDYLPKKDILTKVKHNLLSPMVMIGDRFHDIEAGKANNLYTIGCSYGFGNQDELKESDLQIKSIEELLNYF
ncbi:MAG: HAD family hydrolase [Candidatus Izemoplasmataceae bacterium]